MVWELTPLVETLNVAVFCPEATLTEAGTLAELVLLERETEVPPLPAGPLRVTVPILGVPPGTVVGLSETETRLAGDIVSVAV